MWTTHGLGTRLYRTQPCSQGLSWVPMHIQAQVFKITTVFSLVKYGFCVLPSSLQSVIYSCPRGTSWCLESVATTQTTKALTTHNNHEISCHSACQVLCLTLWESTTLVYFVIYSHYSQCFLFCHPSYTCHKLQTMCWLDSVHAHAHSSHVYLDITHVIKRNRLSPSLMERAWEQG